MRLDSDFKFDLERNFRTLGLLRYPQTVKWMEVGDDEIRAILQERGMLQ